MKFAKIVCGAIQVPQNYPCQIMLDGQVVINPTEEQYRAAGYLPLEETEPEEMEGKIAIAVYTENKRKKKIVQSCINCENTFPQPVRSICERPRRWTENFASAPIQRFTVQTSSLLTANPAPPKRCMKFTVAAIPTALPPGSS